VEIVEAIKRGQASGISQVTNFLFDQAENGNTSAAIFYLKNRAHWKDKHEHTGSDDGPLKIELVDVSKL
jgi:hypothetical protein